MLFRDTVFVNYGQRDAFLNLRTCGRYVSRCCQLRLNPLQCVSPMISIFASEPCSTGSRHANIVKHWHYHVVCVSLCQISAQWYQHCHPFAMDQCLGRTGYFSSATILMGHYFETSMETKAYYYIHDTSQREYVNSDESSNKCCSLYL